MPAFDARHKRLDGFAVLGFCLAFFSLFFPIGADICFALLVHHRYVDAALIGLLCYAIVLIPFSLSWRRQSRHSDIWRGRGYFIGTALILGLHALFWIVGLAQMLVTTFSSD